MTDSTQVFQDGGKLKENAFYIEREADKQLYRNLINGEYCSILDPRQVGKSSLMERTARRLEQAGFKCGNIDLQSFANADITFEKLVNSLIFTICRSLDIKNDNLAFLKNYEQLSANKVLEQFFREIVFPQVDSKIVLFIDEVDIVKSFKNPSDANNSFSENINNTNQSSIGDSFFLTFRSLHESRTSAPFDCLAVCFAGVAFPADLVSRPEISPFNVGKRITLSDFSFEEMQGFRQGLKGINANPDEVIAEVYRWTSGHPYMTQKIFSDLTKIDFSGKDVKTVVADRVNQLFFVPNISPDANLAYAVKRLTSPFESDAAKTRRPQILETFLRIKKAEGKKILLERNLTDNETPSYDESRLFGLTSLVQEQNGSYLKVRNLIYDGFFSDEWLINALNEQRAFRPFFERWLKSGKSDDYLLRGEALDSTIKWATGREDITKEEREFIDRSQEFNQQQVLTAEQAKRAKLFRIAAVLLTFLLISALYAWYQANDQWQQAQIATLLAKNSAQEAMNQSEIAENSKAKALILQNTAEQSEAIAKEKSRVASEQSEIAKKSEANAKQQTEVARRAEEEAIKARDEAVISKSVADARTREVVAEKAEVERQKAEVERQNIEVERLKAVVEDTAAVKLRQERSTQTKYNEEQKLIFEKDALDIAIKKSIPTALPMPLQTLPTEIPPSAEKFENPGDDMKYIGERTIDNVSKNYFLRIKYSEENNSNYGRYYYRDINGMSLNFQDDFDPNSGKQIFMPTILQSTYLSEREITPLFLRSGEFLFFNTYGELYNKKTTTKTFITDALRKFFQEKTPETNLRPSDLPILLNTFQSKKPDGKTAFLLFLGNSLTKRTYSYHYLVTIDHAALDNPSGDKFVAKVIEAYYFVPLRDDIFLYEDEAGFHKIDINSGKSSFLSSNPQGKTSRESLIYTGGAYNEKKNIVAILKLTSLEKASVEIFDLSAKKLLKNLPVRPALHIIFSPDGKYLLMPAGITQGSQNQIQVLNISTQKIGRLIFESLIGENRADLYSRPFFSFDGNRLIVLESNTSNNESTIHIFESESEVFQSPQSEIKVKEIPHREIKIDGAATSASFNDAGDLLFIGDSKGRLRVWNTKDEKFEPGIEFPFAITDIKVEGTDLIISTADENSTAVNFEKEKLVKKKTASVLDYVLSGLVDLKISPTFEGFATFDTQNVRLWNSQGILMKKLDFKETVSSIEYSSDGKHILVYGISKASIWNIEENIEDVIVLPVTEIARDIFPINLASFSNSGKNVLIEFQGGYGIYATQEKRITIEDLRKDKTSSESNDTSKIYGANRKFLQDIYIDDEEPTLNAIKILPYYSRFSPDEEILIVVSNNENDESILGILAKKFDQFWNGKKGQRNLVRFINLADNNKVIKEFFVDNFQYVKFSKNSNQVAIFTTSETENQCFIADTKNEEKTEALLIPLENVKFGDFSSDEKLFVTSNGKGLFIYDTATASLKHQTDLPYPNNLFKGKAVTPSEQKIDYVKFAKNDEVEVGRKLFYDSPRFQNASNTNVSTNSNVSASNYSINSSQMNTTLASNTISTAIQSKTTARITNNPRSGPSAEVRCYQINKDGILVTKSRCEK